MKWRTGSRSSPSSSAVVPDLNIEVKVVSRLWNVRPSCADWTCSLSRLWGGLAGVNKGHERVQLVVRYLVSNSWLSGGRLTDGIESSGLFCLQCRHSVVRRHLGGDRSLGSPHQ